MPSKKGKNSANSPEKSTPSAADTSDIAPSEIKENKVKIHTTFKSFYPYYLSEHRNKVCRRLHIVGACSCFSAVVFNSIFSADLPFLNCLWILSIGTTNAFFIVLYALFKRNPKFTGLAVLQGYFFAWVGHFFFEKNKPATFKYPIYSFLADWVMWYETITGKRKF
ncbi:hypothetical protein BKA69DRAFT_118279 [Paraphysoderma sedebokerense]|nr:hypothetical protein BKA69DRAFT_118279 [Paraphysoderma sedebokerense]